MLIVVDGLKRGEPQKSCRQRCKSFDVGQRGDGVTEWRSGWWGSVVSGVIAGGQSLERDDVCGDAGAGIATAQDDGGVSVQFEAAGILKAAPLRSLFGGS
ncbi:MAG: hypothetical protein ACK55P_17390 [Planctomyces sp.]